MDFSLKLIQEGLRQEATKKRIAIRGVIISENKLLMIKTKHGDVKLPGGGQENNETHEETLIREIKEETGYEAKPIRYLGKTVQRSADLFEENDVFEMDSHYYEAELLTLKRDRPTYSQNEKVYEMKVVWVTLDEAIELNTQALGKTPWVDRELAVLKKLKERTTEK